MALGAALPSLVSWTSAPIIPLPIEPARAAGELALALVYGLLTALAFALWPLGRAHDVPVGALFRDAVAPQPRWPRKIYMALTALAVARAGGARRAARLRPARGGRSMSAPPPRCSCCCGWSRRC